MADHSGDTLAVLGRTWGAEHEESAFVMRAVAAALSRIASVQVLAPGPATPGRPDGAFDLVTVGEGASEAGGIRRWPEPDAASWPPVGSVALAVVEGGDPGARALLEAFLPGVPVVRVDAGRGDGGARVGVGPWLSRNEGSSAPAAVGIGLHVPAHRLAAARGHVGIGFDDYVLVLSDRGPMAATTRHPPRWRPGWRRGSPVGTSW